MEELNHPIWSATNYHYGYHHHHHHHHQAADIVRSFKCSFCNRGFSNAQALGGHMNIHRKDRAKLRQLSNSHDRDEIHVAEDQEHKYRIRRLKRSHSKGVENHHQFQQQLPLLIEATQLSGGYSGPSAVEDYDEEDMFPELDLELRLGPEPADHRMSACLGTRNFF